MEHRQPKMSGKYVPAFSWHKHVGYFLEKMIPESPLLHVYSGPNSTFGDVRVDRFVQPIAPGVIADCGNLPFGDDSFNAVFGDPPWNLGQMAKCAEFCKEALRVAPVAYVMSPWLWVNRQAKRSRIWVREFPGINNPILIVRYERKNMNQLKMALSS